MSILDTTIVNVALETLSRELHAPLSTIQWVSTGYMLALAIVIPLTGWMSERFGAKRVWMVVGGAVRHRLGALRPRLVGRVADLLPRPPGHRRRHDHAGRDERAGPDRRPAPRRPRDERGRRADAARADPRAGDRRPDRRQLRRGAGSSTSTSRSRSSRWSSPRELLHADAGRADAGQLDWLGLAAALARPRRRSCSGSRRPRRTAASPTRSRGCRSSPARCWSPRSCGTPGARDAAADRRAAVPACRVFSAPPSATTFLLAGALFGAMIILPLYYQVDRGESALTAGLLMAPQGLGAAMAMPIAGRLDRQGRRRPRRGRRPGDR